MEWFKRDVDNHLKLMVDDLKRFNEINSDFWEEYYLFVCESFKRNENKRFSISYLAFYLKNSGFQKIDELLLVYIHGLYILAKFDGRSIYGTDFNP